MSATGIARRHYAKGADLRQQMRDTVASFDAEMNKRGMKPVNPE